MRITLGSIVSYIVGLAVAGLSFLALFENVYAVAPLLAGLLILPPTRRWLARSAGIEFNRGAAAAIGVVGVLALLLVLAGSGASGGADSSPGSQVSDVSVSTTNETIEAADTSLEVTWNARAQSAVDPDTGDYSTYQSNDGEKYLVVRMKISNTGDSGVDLTPRAFRVESDGVVYDSQTLFGSGNSLSDVTLTPGGTYSGWVAFSIPEDTSTGTLQVDQEAYYNQRIKVSFTHATEMSVNMSA